MEVQDILNVRVKSAEIQGMTIYVKTLYHILLTLRGKSTIIEWVLKPQ